MFKNLKDFLLRGNILDLAVGVIIGAAFGKIVDSLVKTIIMPLIGFASGGINFTDRAFILREAVKDGEKIITQPIVLGYGIFLQSILDFMLVGVSLFFLLKLAGQKTENVKKINKTEVILTDIKDHLEQTPPINNELLEEIRNELRQFNQYIRMN